MIRKFSFCVVLFLLTLIVPVRKSSPKQHVQAAPVGTGSIVLVARDLIDLKWDPSTYPNPSGETFLRWEIWRGLAADNYTDRVRVGFDKTTRFYRDEGLALDTTYYYRLDYVTRRLADNKEVVYTVFSDNEITGVFQGTIYEDLILGAGTYLLGDDRVVVADNVALTIGKGTTVKRPSPGAGYGIYAIGGTLNIDGANFDGALVYYGNPDDEEAYGYGYVRNAEGVGIYIHGESKDVEIKNNKNISVSLSGSSTAGILENPSVSYITLKDEAYALIQTNVISNMVTINDQASADILNKNTIWSRVELNESAYANITNKNTLHGGVLVSGYGSLAGKKAHARIRGNTLTSEFKNQGVDVYYGASAVVTDNTIEWTGFHGTESSVLLHVSDDDTNVTAQRNKFLNGKIGIFWGATVTVTENVLSGGGAAITIGCVVCGTDIQARGKIEKNTIQNGWGFELWGGSEKGIDDKQALLFQHNCIRNNNPGLTTDDIFMTRPVNMEKQWWGHETGPYHPILNPTGKGDRIEGSKVDFDPWDESDEYCLDEPPEAPLPDLGELIVDADPRELPPDGASTAWISAKVRDENGDPAADIKVEFDMPLVVGKWATSPDCITDASGECRVRYIAPDPEELFFDGSFLGIDKVTIEGKVSSLSDQTEIEFIFLKVTSTIPQHEAHNVDWANGSLSAVFDREVNPDTIRDDTFMVRSTHYYNSGIPCVYYKSDFTRPKCSLEVLSDLSKYPYADKGLFILARLKGGLKGVKGLDSTFMKTDYTWTVYTTPKLLPTIFPVQISEGVDLLRGRQTVVRVHAGLSEESELEWVDADVTLTYDGGRTGTYKHEKVRFYRGEISVGEARIRGNSDIFYSRRGEVPLMDPYTTGTHTIEVEVEPSNQISPPGNIPREYPGNTSVGINLLKSPYWQSVISIYPIAPDPDLYIWGKFYPYNWEPKQRLDFLRDNGLLKSGKHYVEKFFPLLDLRFWYKTQVVEEIFPILKDPKTWLPRLIRVTDWYSMGLGETWINSVVLVPWEWMKKVNYSKVIYHGPSHHACIAAGDAPTAYNPELAVAYCLGHLSGLRDITKSTDFNLKGFDIPRDHYVDSRYSDLGYLAPLMGYDYLTYGKGPDQVWVDAQNYKKLIQVFTSSTAKTAEMALEEATITVGGEILNQDAELTGLIDVTEMPARGMRLPSPDGSGDYSMRLRNCQDQEISTHKFTPIFSTLGDGLKYASFLYNITALEDACVIELLHGTEVLSKVIASRNKPQVSIVRPTSGSYSGELSAGWSGSDADSSDELTYSVYYSQDGGTTWDVLAFATKGLDLMLDTADYANCQACQIKVIAHDGFYSDETFSDTFTVTNPPTVTWTWPYDGAMDAGLMTEVVAVFRDAMNASTIGSSTFMLQDQWGNQISGTVTYNETTQEVVFTPANPLHYGRSYTASLKSTIKDALGQSLGSDFEWTFRVELGPFPIFLPIVMGQK